MLTFAIFGATARAEVQGPCANVGTEGFRPYLPDCRAYELSSPPFKAGSSIEQLEAVGEDGESLVAKSVGAYAETESDPLSAYYLLTRTPSGWTTAAISPPASLFPANHLFAVGADAHSTLWAQRGRTQSIYASDLYIRRPEGAFVKVGSMVPPAAAAGPPGGGFLTLPVADRFAGASSDLSHVLFNIVGGPYWPGDTTLLSGFNTSLYEYVGSENRTPALVGVSDGNTVVNGEQRPAGTVLSNCAVEIGSAQNSADTYNAVSANGETVYFTAQGKERCSDPAAPEASELYARVGGVQTVAISEPTASDCEVCNTSLRTPALFQGASQDGTKAFFLSEQELLSGQTTMNLYEYDFNSPKTNKVILVSKGSPTPEVQGVTRVSMDGTHVYFVAKAALTEGANGEGRVPEPGENNLYLFERDSAYPGGRLAFVATLASADEPDWKAADSRPVQATPDGRYLLFQSTADLTPGDSSSVPQIFEYDAASEELVRVSRGENGYASGDVSADANESFIETEIYEASFNPAVALSRLAMTHDGSTVVFESQAALTPQAAAAAAAGARSAYEYRSQGQLANGNVYLISDGNNALSTEITRLDATGKDIFFNTVDPLLAQDADTQFDLYDARLNGGFSASPAPADCEREGGCQGAAPSQPSVGSPASSAAAAGAGPSSSPPAPPLVSAPTPKPKASSPKQKLAKALRGCRRKQGKKRATCEKQVRRRFKVASGSRPGGGR
jgi:hypothetical protein